MFVLLGNRSDETLSKQEIHHQAENLNLMFGFLSSPTITRLHLHRQFSSRLTSIWRATPISLCLMVPQLQPVPHMNNKNCSYWMWRVINESSHLLVPGAGNWIQEVTKCFLIKRLLDCWGFALILNLGLGDISRF